MSRDHEPELDAVAYVTGVMGGRERRRFERHLLECHTCWEEVRLDREGRRLAEAGRAVAPPGLRELVRASVASAASGDVDRPVVSARPRRRAGRFVAIAAASSLIVLAAAVAVLRPAAEPAPIDAALSAFEHTAVEGVQQDMPSPDLSRVGLRPTGAEHMTLADMPVDGFAYRTDTGSRLTVFMGRVPFPRAVEASVATARSWEAERDGMMMLSGPATKGTAPATFLAVTDDPALMHHLAGALASGRLVIAA